ncbi:hypothetical protein J6590_106733, partial [Homalodisca vitripennis]
MVAERGYVFLLSAGPGFCFATGGERDELKLVCDFLRLCRLAELFIADLQEVEGIFQANTTR